MSSCYKELNKYYPLYYSLLFIMYFIYLTQAIYCRELRARPIRVYAVRVLLESELSHRYYATDDTPS